MWQTTFFERAKSPSTSEKHRVLAKAFSSWVGSGPSSGERVVFDGFAGAGRFATPDVSRGDSASQAVLGSPLLFLTWAQVLPMAARLRFRFIFAEKHPVNFGRLCAALAQTLGQPIANTFVTPKGIVEVHCTTFEHCASELVSAQSRASLFSFVDPYGCHDVRFTTLVALAQRGDSVFHLASHAIYTKLVTASGDSPKQQRQMNALLGGAMSWSDLRRHAASLGAANAKQLIAEVLVRGLEQQLVRTQVTPLRDGESHLIHTTQVPR